MQSRIAVVIWLMAAWTQAAEKPFELQILDAQSGRGIPLVEMETVNRLPYVTDSHGRVAFDEPGLLGQRVFFQMRSHGYEIPKDAFGGVGVAVQTSPGGRVAVQLKRRNIAERLYRITGQGLYADSVKLGRDVPLRNPLINGLVVGQDSTMAIPYRGKVRWFWGDTQRPAHPLGHFQTAGATSLLPRDGGLHPDVGVDLTYFVRDDGFSRPMAPLPEPGMVWIDGILTVPETAGREVLVAHFSRRKDLGTELEHGLLKYDDDKDTFVRAASFDAANSWRHPRGQPTLHAGYWYFAHPFATTRVRATWADVLNPAAYEALALVKNADGSARYDWQKTDSPIDQKSEAARIKTDAASPPPAKLQLRDAETNKPVTAHVGSIRWNAHRQRWVLIVVQQGGTSFLGEVWYAEAPEITGPWGAAVKIVTHEKYSFYNPVQHAFFDQDGGRQIYFEGTYTNTFSGNSAATPRYEYNQVMYRLDVDDPRLKSAQ